MPGHEQLDGETVQVLTPDEAAVRRATLAGAVGSFVEWYDYGIYGLLTTYLAINFMSGIDSAGLILTNPDFAPG